MKSKLELKNKIDYSKKIIVTEIKADEASVSNIEKILLRTLPNEVTLGQFREEVNKKILRESAFHYIMDYLVLQFTFQISSSELTEIKDSLKKQFSNQKENNEIIDEIAKKVIVKSLVFEYIGAENNINVTDEETLKFIDEEKSKFQGDMGKFLSKENMPQIKTMIFEQKITTFLLDKFQVEFNLKK